MKKAKTTKPHPLPCAVQLGFSGSRQLVLDDRIDPSKLAAFELEIEHYLIACFEKLAADLHLLPNHFLVGISQMAKGADLIFARACRNNPTQPIPQRVFLPQHRESYLTAIGSNGDNDFEDEEREEAEALLDSEHIIQERVVSVSPVRSTQFTDTNNEILRVSDVVVCLLRNDAEIKKGGTNDFLRRAIERGTPALEIRVSVAGTSPVFTQKWHNLESNHFQLPHLPEELNHDALKMDVRPLPSISDYCVPLKELVSTQAKVQQQFFRFAAVSIIATHTLATVCASLAVVLHGEHEESHGNKIGIAAILLVIELSLLLIGFFIHKYLHTSEKVRIWATARVVAELSRSLNAIGLLHIYLEHLFRLPLPSRFRYLLRTLNVLQLRTSWPHRTDPWERVRDNYVSARVDNQIVFYADRLKEDRRRLAVCQQIFQGLSLLAIVVTTIKLFLVVQSDAGAMWISILGLLAIVLPVIAVGGLSWAAALDCEARVETFEESLSFLKRTKRLLENATSRNEFESLLLETETVLLGETSNWYSRRANTGVT